MSIPPWQEAFSPEAQAEANRFFAGECRFVLSASTPDDVPYSDQPEVAFVGRSNVGKSSLINALTGQNKLAKASNTPGRTRLLNFFCLQEQLMLVDLPGYGYAKAPKTDIAEWQALTQDYLRGRPQLQRICVLIDSRHGIKANDTEMMKALDVTANAYQLVLTKADKIKAPERLRVWEATSEAVKAHPAAHPQVLLTSADTKEGIPAMRAALQALCSG